MPERENERVTLTYRIGESVVRSCVSTVGDRIREIYGCFVAAEADSISKREVGDQRFLFARDAVPQFTFVRGNRSESRRRHYRFGDEEQGSALIGLGVVHKVRGIMIRLSETLGRGLRARAVPSDHIQIAAVRGEVFMR